MLFHKTIVSPATPGQQARNVLGMFLGRVRFVSAYFFIPRILRWGHRWGRRSRFRSSFLSDPDGKLPRFELVSCSYRRSQPSYERETTAYEQSRGLVETPVTSTFVLVFAITATLTVSPPLPQTSSPGVRSLSSWLLTTPVSCWLGLYTNYDSLGCMY